jgi:diguanylate cyclase
MFSGLMNTVQDLIANFAIVTAYLFLSSQVIFKNYKFGAPVLSLLKLKIGVLTGLLGIILMSFTVSLNGTILDFRQLAVILAALFGGLYSSIIAGVIIFFMRLLAYGTITTATLMAAMNVVLVSIAVGIIFSYRLSYQKKWCYSLLLGNVFTTVVFFLNLGVKGLKPSLIYICMMFIGGAITAYLTHFLIKVKAHFKLMEKEANIDFLTGLNNYRTFDMVFKETKQNALKENEFLSVLLVDIDYFKKVNDTYGHLSGDAVLRQAGELLKNISRSIDIISRNGGEEFSVILCNCPHEEAMIIAERTRLAFKNNVFVLNEGTNIQITISIGVASLSEDKDESIIEQADLALYKAKANGRNQVCSNIVEKSNKKVARLYAENYYRTR